MQQVKDRMNKAIERVNADMSALEVATIMAEKKIGSLLVQKAGSIVGIVTETDLVQKVMASGKNADSFNCD